MVRNDPEVKAIAITSLRFFARGMCFMPLGWCWRSRSAGAGDTRTLTLINLCCYWLFQIPLEYLLAVPIAESALAAVSIVLFRRGKWKLQKV